MLSNLLENTENPFSTVTAHLACTSSHFIKQLRVRLVFSRNGSML